MFPSRKFLCILLALSGLCHSSDTPKSIEMARIKMLRAFDVAKFYQAPDIPMSCLKWNGSRKGDSVLFVATVSKEASCKMVRPVLDRWMMPISKGMPRLLEGADGKGRIDLLPLMGMPMGGENEQALLMLMEGESLSEEDTEAEEENSTENILDAILAGGGGSLRKTNRERKDSEEDVSESDNKSYGTPTIRPPRGYDITLSGDVNARSDLSILRAIMSNFGGFRYTHEKYLRDDPNLVGKLKFQFTIAPSGDITAIKLIDSNTGNANLDQDMTDKVRRLKFDRIKKGIVHVSYTMAIEVQ